MNLENLYNKIKNNMPENLDEIEKTAYIMKVIAEDKRFSSKYYWSDKKTRDKLYLLAKKENLSNNSNKEIVCVTTSRIFKKIATRFGLDVYYVGDDGKISKNCLHLYERGEHVSPVIKLKEKSKYTDKVGSMIKADAEWNFENIKTKSRWSKFAKKDDSQNDFIELSDDKIDEIMINIGYIKNTEEYVDLYYDVLRNKIRGKGLKEQLKILFEDDKLADIMKNLDGSVEIYRFFRRVFKETIDKENDDKIYNKKLYLFGSTIKNKMKNKIKRKYTVTAYLEDDDMIWVYSKKEKRMMEVSTKEMKYFIEKDKMNLVAGKQPKALEKLLRVVGEEQTTVKSKNIKEMVL